MGEVSEVKTDPMMKAEDEAVESRESSQEESPSCRQKCCGWYDFGGSKLARGYCTLGLGRGPLVMSNIFLSTAFIYLASEEAGCLDQEGEIIDDCPNRVHGFKPASLVSTIAVISGLLAAFFMPLIGALVDFTPHRKAVGIWSVVAMILIQLVQAGTVSATWFPMAILQAIVGFIYQIQVLAVFSYLPETAREVGEDRMRNYQAYFTMTQFSAQAGFLILIALLSVALGLNEVETGHMSQGINVFIISIAFYTGWNLLPSVPAKNTLPEGRSLWTAGFVQNYKTIQSIRKNYSRGLFRYLIAVVFAEAGVNAYTVVAVVYLFDHIDMNGAEVAFFMFITLLASLPGSLLAAKVTGRTNPIRSWQIGISCLIVVTIGGSIIVDNAPKEIAYAWGLFLGLFLGWHYPTEGLIFSMCLPEGREAELSGFFVYCTQILGWAPPLIFSALVEADVNQTYGVWSVNIFLVVAIAMMQSMAPWPETLAEARRADTVEEPAARPINDETEDCDSGDRNSSDQD